LISPESSLSINDQCKILGVSKGKLYYKAKGNSEEDLQIMKEMDMEHIEHRPDLCSDEEGVYVFDSNHRCI